MRDGGSDGRHLRALQLGVLLVEASDLRVTDFCVIESIRDPVWNDETVVHRFQNLDQAPINGNSL